MSTYTIHPDIAKARTLPTDFYLGTAAFERSKESIFATAWHFLGHEGLVKENEQCHPFTLAPYLLDEPVMLTRKDKEIYCLPNVCTHRGNLLVKEPCKQTNLSCHYHGRQFELDGSFKSMPEFAGVDYFPEPSDSLGKLSLEKWGDWLFTNLQKEADFESYFGEMQKRLEWLPLDRFEPRPDLDKEYTVKANWALYCENYLEGFHIPFVHPELNSVLDFSNYTTELYRYSSLQLGLAKNKEDAFKLPKNSPDFGKQIAAFYFFVFPNLLFNFYPWGLSLNIVHPVSPELTRVTYLSYVYDESLREKGAGSGLEQVELEDQEVVEAVQRGIRSRFYGQGRYSVKREQGTHHFHRLIAEFMN
ncbi:MAG: aromatic ring-hydroxylating dioxygenase subunit alpha [Flavobacteriaceae bacterium]|nr:aromatic ring-hydroxylating dioxygenase subunit alpha [Flavobacteriaceae bacterium]